MFNRVTDITPSELKLAIVREPLIVKPDTTLKSAIAQMSGVRTICDTAQTVDEQLDELLLEARSSCVLVVEDGRLLGILTERDAVRLIAQQRSLEELSIRGVMAYPVITLHESAFTDLFFASNLLQQYHIRHIPILDEHDRLVGLVTHESLRQTSRPVDILRLRLVSEVMTSEVICAAPDSSMLEIAQRMAKHHVGSVIIVQPGGSQAAPLHIPVGILTERHIVQSQALGLNLETCMAQAVMSTPIFAVRPDDSLWTVQQMMEQRSIGRLAVTNQQGALLGIVTQTSLLQALNPLELYKLAQMWEEKVVRLETEKAQLLENLLEQEVETRTIALKAKAGREKLVADVATQIRSSLSLQTILDTTVEQVRQVLGCDRVNIWQCEADWQTIAVAESTDSSMSLIGERINDTCFNQDQAEIYRQGRIRVVPDIYTTRMSDCHRDLLIRLQTRAKIVVPLLCGDRLWGLLIASESQHPREWLPEEVELLQALSVHLAIAIQQATTHQQLQEELRERQEAEARLRESEQRYATLAAAAPVGIFRTDAEGLFTYINDRFFQIAGIAPENAIEKGWQQALHPDDRDWVIAHWEQYIQDENPFQLEYRFQRPDGVVTWVYGQSLAEWNAEGQVIGYVGTVTDISDRKQAESLLQKSEERYATLVEAAPVGIFRTDAAGNCLYVNDRWCQLSGLTPKTAAREGWRQGLHPDDRDAISVEWYQSAQDNRPFQLEYRFQRPDGVVTWVYGQSVAELDAEGEVVGYVGTVTDISDRKQTELALSQLAAIVESSADAIISKTLDSAIVSWNAGAEKLFGYKAQEVIGQSILLLIPTELRNEESSIMEKIQQGEPIHYYETVRQNKDGKLMDISLTVSPIKDATGKIVGASKIARDISDRKLAEAALIQSEAQSRAILAAIPDFMFRIGADGIYRGNVTANREIDVLGIDVNTLGVAMVDVISGEIATRHLHYLEQALSTGELQVYEQQVPIGDRIQYEEIRIIKSGEDEALFMIRDISDRKLALSALIQSEAHQRALISAIPDLIMRIDRAGIYLEFVTTSSNFHVLGNLSEVVGSHVSTTLPPDLTQKRMDFIQLALEMNSIQIYEHELCIDGRKQIEEVRVVPYSKDEVLALVRDISDRKLAEAALIQSEAQSRAILAAIPDFMFRIGADGIYRGGVTPNRDIDFLPADFDTVGLAMVDLVPAEIATRDLHYLEQALRTGELQVYEQQVHIGDRIQYEEIRIIKSGEDEALFIIRDISDRKQAEQALMLSQEQLSLVLKGSNEGWWDWNLIDNNIYYSPRWWGILGYEPGELEGAPDLWQQLMHPDDLDRVNQFLHQQITNGIESYEVEFRLLHKQEHYVPVISRGFILRNDRGTPVRISGTNTDLTELKKVEEQLRQLNQELEAKVAERTQELWQVNSLQRAILDGGDYSIISTDLTGIIQTFNTASERMLGYSAAEMVGKVTPAIIHDVNEVIDRAASLSAELGQDVPPGFEVFVAKARQGIVSEEECSYIRKDGSGFPVSLSITVLKDANQQIIGFLGIAKDISDRKRTAAELQKLSDRLALSLKSGAIGSWEWNLGQNTILGDDRMYELFGLTKQSDSYMVYDFWMNTLHPHDRTSTETLLQQAILGQAEYDTEYRVLHPDGSIHFIKANGVVVPDAQGNPQSMIGINFDITDRKQAELERQQLIQELSAFKLALDRSAIVAITDAQGAISYVNDRFCAISGYSRDELIGQTHRIVNSGYHPPAFFQDLWRTITSGQIWRGEICNRTKNGSLYWVASTIVPFLDEGGRPFQYLAIRFEITARKLAQATLQQENTFRQQIVENMAEGLCVFHEVKEFPFVRFTVWNQQMQAITGYSLEEINHLGWYQTVYPYSEAQEQAIANLRQMQQGEHLAQDREIQRQDGQKRTIAISASILSSNDGLIYTLALIQDITDRKQIEAQLAESEGKFRRLVEGGKDVIWSSDKDGIITYLSPQFKNVFGWEESEWIGKPFRELVHPDDILFVHSDYEQNVNFSKNSSHSEFRHHHNNGNYIWVRTSITAIRNAEGVVINIQGVLSDITDRKQAELRLEQQAKQERLLGSITQRMRSSLNLKEILKVTVEEIHQVLQSDRMLVYRVFPGGTGAAIAESVLPKWPRILDIVFPEEVFPQKNYDRYLQGRVYALSDREDENQSVLPCLIEFLESIQVRAKLVVPIILNQTLWGLLIAHHCDRPRQWEDWEINLFKQTANQLAIAIQQSNLFEQLQTELAERQRAEARLTETNAQLAISNEELARATRLKDEFLANMSHELRTPLNAILGMSEGLQDRVFGSINEPQMKALQTIERSGFHLLELINDILDVAKIESGQMELDCTPVSVNHLCQSSLAFIKQQAMQKRIQLGIELPLNLPDLLIDERRIRQVLINLLNNAVKFTPEGGRITLEVSRQQRQADPNSADSPPHFFAKETLQIAVIDTGIGIAPEDINKLFQPFIQIDSALNRQYQGTGLGLALVKRIVELHGGQVLLTSEVGVGSCFTIDLPCTAGAPSSRELESQTEPRIEPSGPEQEGSPLILLAEDNEANISTVSSYLRAKGYRILLAKNGEEAIALAKSENPNLILMDIQMPGMDGLEAMQQIRLDPNLVDVPIVALTALAMTGDRDRCLAAGANDYLTKPVKLKQLAATIQQLLTSQRR
ncbi:MULTISPECIES: PAS domain S-box protein [unclassified Microcoleus]|uniref:PAS domain S-box protein n=1 Tax=unclassified Microcoleus TaxID=2642155 RepID=UPI002FD2A827